jgi:hypothetical protein
MTSRSTFLTFAALLLIASLAGAATPAVTSTNSSVGAPAFMAPAAPSTGCDKAELPFLAPTPSMRTGGAPCGSCSSSPCAGYTTGTVCGYANGRYSTCQDVWGGACPGTPAQLICECWNGPLP